MSFSTHSKIGAGAKLHWGAAPQTVTIANASDVATVTLNAHGLAVGDFIEVIGVDEAAFAENAGLKVIATVPDANSFTYAATGADDGSVTAAAGQSLQAIAFAHLEQADAVGETGETTNFVVSRRMHQTTNGYLQGVGDTPDKDIVCADVPGDAGFAAFLAHWQAQKTAKGTVRFMLLTVTDTTLLYSVSAGAYRYSEPGEEEQMITFSGKQSGEVIRGENA